MDLWVVSESNVIAFLKNCIFIWLCWVFVVCRGFSLVVASRGYSLDVGHRLFFKAAFLVAQRLQNIQASVVVAPPL